MHAKRFEIDCIKDEVYDAKRETWVVVPYYRLYYKGEAMGRGFTRSYWLLRLQARGTWMVSYSFEEEDEYDGSC